MGKSSEGGIRKAMLTALDRRYGTTPLAVHVRVLAAIAFMWGVNRFWSSSHCLGAAFACYEIGLIPDSASLSRVYGKKTITYLTIALVIGIPFSLASLCAMTLYRASDIRLQFLLAGLTILLGCATYEVAKIVISVICKEPMLESAAAK